MHRCWFVVHRAIPFLKPEGFLVARESVIDVALAPFNEEKYEDLEFEKWPKHTWDWYQIGGRWTGLLDGYDVRQDPIQRDVWPTEYKSRVEDTQPVEKWPTAAQPYLVLFPDGRVIDVHDLTGQFWLAWHQHALREWAGHEVTIADCHS